MFSEMTRIRPAWARRPDAAMPIDFRKSISASPLRRHSSALADRRLDQAEALRIERRPRLVVHLVGGDLHHLVFHAHRIAGGRVSVNILWSANASLLPPVSVM